MSRIRTIKPCFFRHEALYEAEKATGFPLRVAYPGLWTVADCEGRFKWRPRELKLDCLPYDDLDFADVLDALAQYGFVVKYQINGETYGCIPSFPNHQVINKHESASAIPALTEESIVHVHAHADPCMNVHAHGEGNGKEGNGKEGNGKEGNGKEGEGNGYMVAGATVSVPPAGDVIIAEVVDPFDTLWEVFPKREGSNPKKPAADLADKLVRSGRVTWDELIAGAKRYARVVRDISDRSHVKQLKSWLYQECWRDRDEPITGNRKGSVVDACDQLKEACANGYDFPERPLGF